MLKSLISINLLLIKTNKSKNCWLLFDKFQNLYWI